MSDDNKNPEQVARDEIDARLRASGWAVQGNKAIDHGSAAGVAVREYKTSIGPADYVLFADKRPLGVVEAKPESWGARITTVEEQSSGYAAAQLKWVKTAEPLPFIYESTGTITRFTDGRDPKPRSREVFSFHRPETLRDWLAAPKSFRSGLQDLPALNTAALRHCQITAITKLEESLKDGRPRALVQMATGSGKTFTAISEVYRLLKFAGARRVLFLVDTRNLGEQAEQEFLSFVPNDESRKFTELYTVQRLTSSYISPHAQVCISTIQRLYSILKGEELAVGAEDDNPAERRQLRKDPLPVVYNASLPPEFFDVVIIDECHRSIYNLWRQVIEYFDSFLIGLTATPDNRTYAFFQKNVVSEYTHERAVADGVNVGNEIYLIETEVTSAGAKIKAEQLVERRERQTRRKRWETQDAEEAYAATQLDRSVVNPDQIRTVIRAFRDKLPEIFPGRTEVPKTLIFAKTDLHAEDVVAVVREAFGKGNDFCVKITSKADDPDASLKKFQNEHFPRVAVTVDMIATGTDVKPLECVVFLRNVKSLSYFEQMKGRGCRVATADEMAKVNIHGRAKTHFVIVDCVGVCEHPKTDSKPLDRKPSVAFDKVLQFVAAGGCDADTVSTLGARLARLEREVTPEQADRIVATAGAPLKTLITDLLDSVNEVRVAARAAEKFQLAADVEPTEEQLDATELELMQAATKPFRKAALRKVIQSVWEEVNSQWQVLDEETVDRVIRAEFDPKAKENAAALVADFRQFCDENKDQIEALQLLYSKPYRFGLRYGHLKELAAALKTSPKRFDPERIWHAFEVVDPDTVKVTGPQKLVDLIALVRHAIDPTSPLVPVELMVNERYAAWVAEREASGRPFTADERKWLDAIRDHIATSVRIDRDDLSDVPFNQMGGLGMAAKLFGDMLDILLEELNTRLAA